MTQQEFNVLPALLSASEFRRHAGISRDKLRDLRVSKAIDAWPNGNKFKYYKADLAKMLRLQICPK